MILLITTNLFALADSTYFHVRDSIIATFDLSSKSLPSEYLTANVTGKNFSLNLPKEISSCHNPIFINFNIENKFTLEELELLTQKKDATFQDSVNFLNDNDIVSSLFRIKVFESGKLIIAEKIGIDINVNFPEVIEKYYFIDGLSLGNLVMVENLECSQRLGVYLLHLFYYKGTSTQIRTLIFKNDKTEVIVEEI